MSSRPAYSVRFGAFFATSTRTNALRLAILMFTMFILFNGQSSPAQSDTSADASIAVRGSVRDVKGKPLPGAAVTMSSSDGAAGRDATADTAGHFDFQNVKPGKYSLQADWHGQRSIAVQIEASSDSPSDSVALIISATSEGSDKHKETAMEFTDEPSFTIAGVTDWTAVGGHGSDANLRTSETLAKQTASMQDSGAQHRLPGLPVESSAPGKSEAELRNTLAKDPQSFRANHDLGDFLLRAGRSTESIAPLETANHLDPSDSANAYELALAYRLTGDLKQARTLSEHLIATSPGGNAHRLIGEIDEAQGDPLNAVREFETASRIDPSEDNYFAWGSELLLHRAVWQAKEVFEKGSAVYPKSSRMETGLGASLFAGALYEQSAQRLCQASDLDPADPQPYEILGKVDAVAPDPLPCIEERLARFAAQQPSNSEANYLYGAAILRRHPASAKDESTKHAEALLTRAIALDSHCGEAYLQLGILSSSRRDTSTAVDYFQKAIAARPELGEAHYRLAVAYDRMGEKEKAQQEFALHDSIEKEQAEAIERQRHAIKQFEVASQPVKN